MKNILIGIIILNSTILFSQTKIKIRSLPIELKKSILLVVTDYPSDRKRNEKINARNDEILEQKNKELVLVFKDYPFQYKIVNHDEAIKLTENNKGTYFTLSSGSYFSYNNRSPTSTFPTYGKTFRTVDLIEKLEYENNYYIGDSDSGIYGVAKKFVEMAIDLF
jgi:hypothetical protein